KAKTTTETQTVVETQTVPVEHVRTVVKVRRVVRTQTLTVDVPAADGGGAGGSYDGGSGAGSADQYAGMTCAEIGHSFTVTPGSDPEHDRDNDGIACESYPP